MSDFQTQVTLYPAQGNIGNLASESSARQPAVPPQGGFRAGVNGLYSGRFAWRDENEASWLNNTGAGKPLGVILNEGYGQVEVNQNGSLYILAGTQVSCWTMIDIWVQSSTPAKVGDKAFAKLTDGSVAFGAAGTSMDGFIETDFSAATDGAANSAIIMTRFGV